MTAMYWVRWHWGALWVRWGELFWLLSYLPSRVFPCIRLQ